MKLKCVKLAVGLNSAIFFWDEGAEGARKKAVKTLGLNEEFEVDDLTGHEIISKYKEAFKVVSYGSSVAPAVEEKSVVAPRTVVIKEERTK